MQNPETTLDFYFYTKFPCNLKYEWSWDKVVIVLFLLDSLAL